jgi:hypothetical protein
MSDYDTLTFHSIKDSERTFKIAKDTACAASPVLHEKFENVANSGESNIRLPCKEFSERCVELLTKFIKTEKFAMKLPEVINRGRAEADMILAELYVMATKLRMPKLQNAIVKRLHEIFTSTKKGSLSIFEYAYEKTAAGSALRKLCVYECANFLGAQTLGNSEEQLPKQLLLDVVLAYKKGSVQNADGVEDLMVNEEEEVLDN